MSLYTLSDIKLPLGKSENELLVLAQKKLKGKVGYFRIRKKSLDARDKNNIRYIYTIEFSKEERKTVEKKLEKLPKNKIPQLPVVVVGSGPAGLFCALRLLERGIKPIVIERGAPVEEREEIINRFFQTKFLDTQSNIQFGEGGAGTFSDGKLNTQTHSPLQGEVLDMFVRFGAPKEIAYLNKPHLGSDNLKKIVKNIREYILSQGGEIRFHTLLEDLFIENGTVKEISLRNLQKEKEKSDFAVEKMPVSALVLAVGHSARDTFEKLLARGVLLRQKDFAVGVRIEHLQSEIGFAQYGKAYKQLPPADYKLVSHASDRACFTFCMCPGGFVMPASSEEGGVVVNGMSNYARNEENANSALIAQVSRADFEDDGPLAGVEFQRKLERTAFLAGGENYSAPVQLLGDFLIGKTSTEFGEVKPSYLAGTKFADLHEVLPVGVAQSIALAVKDMDKRLHGFANPHAVLTAVESRTSSPVRMERDENLQSVGISGLFPCGEGAGYAGGITSSAVDGIRVADGVFARFMQE